MTTAGEQRAVPDRSDVALRHRSGTASCSAILAALLLAIAGLAWSPPSAGAEEDLAGQATWYCLPGRSTCTVGHRGGLYAAAGPTLRAALGEAWRGAIVAVCSGSRCVRVELIDWCACPGRRAIDLYADAFARIARLSAGVIPVTIRLADQAPRAIRPSPPALARVPQGSLRARAIPI